MSYIQIEERKKNTNNKERKLWEEIWTNGGAQLMKCVWQQVSNTLMQCKETIFYPLILCNNESPLRLKNRLNWTIQTWTEKSRVCSALDLTWAQGLMQMQLLSFPYRKMIKSHEWAFTNKSTMEGKNHKVKIIIHFGKMQWWKRLNVKKGIWKKVCYNKIRVNITLK